MNNDNEFQEPEYEVDADEKALNIANLKEMSIGELARVAKDLQISGVSSMRKQALIFQILKARLRTAA